jgi:hypothetical protein
MYAPPAWLIALGAVATGLGVGVALYLWPPTRDTRRIGVAAIASIVGFLVWRAALITANGANLDVDYDVLLGLSFEDIGSGVMSFLATALALGLGMDRGELAGRVVRTAALAGIAAMLVDRFV